MESTDQAPASTVREIESREDLDAALAALVELDTQESQALAELELKLTEVRESFEDRFLVTLDQAENQPIDTVRTDLMLSIERYCQAHKEVLLLGLNKKSMDLTHGTIGWRAGKDQINELKQTEKQKANGVLAYAFTLALTALNGIKKIFSKVLLADVVRIDVTWDKQKILKSVDEGLITPSQLKKAGLEIVKGVDKFYVKAKSEAVDPKP